MVTICERMFDGGTRVHERLIVHVDMDAFYASIEVRDNVQYQGLPVVVGGAPGGRGVVAAASYAARHYGIRSAMPVGEALARCPHAIFLPVDMAKYRAVSAQLFELLETFTPRIEPVSIDEAFLDLTGCPLPSPAGEDGTLLLAGARAIKARIGETLRLPVSVGGAPNKFLAKLASELAKPDGLREIRAEHAKEVLAPLPVTVLWGVGAQTHQRLRGLGIHTVGDLEGTPPSVLRAALGFAAEQFAQLSRGIDDRPVETSRETKSIGRETTFDQDTADRDVLVRTLGGLAEDVAHSLRAEGVRGKTVTLKLRYSNFHTLTRNLTLPTSTNSGAAVLRAACGLLDRLGTLSRPVRLIGVSVSGLGRADLTQVSLFGDEEAQVRVDQVTDAINERFGEGTVRRAREVDPDPDAG
jgi:DNA polymerase-4